MKRVAIVGGGPGGLFSAFLLKSKSLEPIDITIFEASACLGGKLQTASFDTRPVPYEAGAAEIYQYGDDPLRLLIKEILGLPVKRMRGQTVVLDGHLIRDFADLGRFYGVATQEAVEDFDKLAHQTRDFDVFYNGSRTEDNDHPWSKRSFASVIDEVPDQTARRYLRVLVHSDLATEPESTSALYGIDNYLINDPEYCKLYSVQGGMSRFIAKLCESIEARIELNSPVTAVEKSSDSQSYRLTYQEMAEERTAEFDAVAVALPMAWLPNLQWRGELLNQAMSKHHEHYDFPAHYLRISILFRKPFWGSSIDGSFFMIDAFGGCCVYDEGSRLDVGEFGVLSWLIAGADAERQCHCSDQELIEAALDSFPAEFGPAREDFLEGKVHRWLNSVNALPGGRVIQDLNGRHIPEFQDHPRLYIVGDYMFDTSLNGVLDSADYMTDLMLDALQIKQLGVDGDYFDHYLGKESYDESYREAFDPQAIVKSIRVVWGERPPYSLLDAGSANGLTLVAFGKLGITATGVEVHPFIHAMTPKRLKPFNLLGNVCDLPFADGAFDFVYETCLAHVHEADLPRAMSELQRVTRLGLILGSVVADFRSEIVEMYKLHTCVKSLKSLREWNQLLSEHGFEPALLESQMRDELGKIKTRAFGGTYRFADPESLGLCFLSKAFVPSRVLVSGPSDHALHSIAQVKRSIKNTVSS